MAPRHVFALGAVAVAVLLQTTVLARLPLPGATPDLAVLVVLGLALRWGAATGAGAGFAAGMLLDLVPPADHELGRWALVLTLVGYLLGLRPPPSPERSLPALVLTSAAAAAGALVGFAVLGALLGDTRVRLAVVLHVLPFTLAYAAVLGPFVVAALWRSARGLVPDAATRR